MQVQSDKCSGCGICADICGNDAITFERNGGAYGSAKIDTLKCISCGACVEECPKNAIKEN